MGLKDAVKKVKEKVQGMAARPYIGIDMAAGEDMTAYAWQQETAQKPEEAPEGNQAENNSAQTRFRNGWQHFRMKSGSRSWKR